MTTTSSRPAAGKPGPNARPVTRQRRSLYQLWNDSLGNRPGLDYLMLRIILLTIIGIGLLMAYSASMASSWVESGSNSVWQLALKQTVFVLSGLFIFWLAIRTPPRYMRTLALPFLILACLLLIAVLTPLGTGRETVGSQSWIYFGPFSVQPSEVARIAIGVYGAATLSGHTWGEFPRTTLKEWLRDPYTQFLMVSGVFFLLIAAQGDVGMAALFALVAVLTLFFAGMTNGMFVVIGLVVVGGVAYLLMGGGFRSNRFLTFFDAFRGHIQDTQGTGFQTYQGLLSLADGGAAGVGLGQSRAKWFYLPEARNDFIFAVVGEELGLWGALVVVVLFAMLGFFGIRTAMRAQNQFQGLVAATLTATVVSQAMFNIAYVIGIMPVTGVQLPMISAGGSATIVTIGAMGLLCNVARHEPQQVTAMQSTGRPLFDRILLIPEPQPDGAGAAPRARRAAAPARQKASRDRFGEPVTARRRPAGPGTAGASGGTRLADDAGRSGSGRTTRAVGGQAPRRTTQQSRARDFERRRAGSQEPREGRYRHEGRR